MEDRDSSADVNLNQEAEPMTLLDTVRPKGKKPSRTPGPLPKDIARKHGAIVEQLSRSFEPLNWGDATERLDFDVVGSFLEVKHADDIEQMCELGLLKPLGKVEDRDIDGAEVLRFLKQHGAAWMQGRLEAQISRLEGQLAASTTRAQPRKKYRSAGEAVVESLRAMRTADLLARGLEPHVCADASCPQNIPPAANSKRTRRELRKVLAKNRPSPADLDAQRKAARS